MPTLAVPAHRALRAIRLLWQWRSLTTAEAVAGIQSHIRVTESGAVDMLVRGW
jgi:hypothetical protein